MPNETENTPIVEPLSATEGVFDLDQSGHKAFSKDKAPSKNSSENPYKTLGTLKLSFTMTGEEALNELRYGKKGTPESLAAVNLLAAKAVERFGDGDNNFLTKYSGWNDWKGLLRNNGNDWEVAAHLLGADVKQVVNDQPWKMKAFDRLADSALTLRVASGLTEKYVNGNLRKDSDKEQYNKFSPELRRQLLRQYGTPAELPAWFDQTIASPSTPNRPASRAETTPPPPDPDEEVDLEPTELDKIAFEYLNKLTEEQRGYLMGSFDEADLIVAAQRLNKLTPGTLKYLAGLRDREGVVIFTPDEKDGLTIGLRTSMKMTELDDILGDENRLNKGFGIIEDFMDDTGLSFDALMALNMMAYSTEESAYIQNDFNFKAELYKRYTESQPEETENKDIVIEPTPKVEILDEDETEVFVVDAPEDIADEIDQIRQDGNIPIFSNDWGGRMVHTIDTSIYSPYIGHVEDIGNNELDLELSNILSSLPNNNIGETEESKMGRVLLTREPLLEGEDGTFEDQLRVRLLERYKETIN